MTLPAINPSQKSDNIIFFIQKIFSDANKSTAVVAVSGGIDSATTLMLTTKALQPQNIQVLHLPSRHSHPDSLTHGRLITKTANIPEENSTIINIGSIIQKTWRIIHHYAGTETHKGKGQPNRKEVNEKIITKNKLRLANIAARTRMMCIYDHAKRHDALVVGTENMSEHLLGYFTRFGDEASDLEPIKHLYKTQVYDLARYLAVPQPIIEKAPTADLWKNQTDESEMGFSYIDADPILYLHNQGKSSEEIISQGFDQTLVKKVLNQVKSTQFKHRAPYTL